MAHLTDIDPAFRVLLGTALEDGLVSVKKHPQYDLWLANYTPKAQYDREWNVVTRNCRGLIFDSADNIVARPFPKFFNWDESHVEKIPVGPVLVSQKFDGSLGVLYRTPFGELKIATRGSFVSEQAGVGTLIFERIVSEMGGFEPEDDKTYLFEIIYPENRIVVDYGGQERMVLLDVIDNATGKSDLEAFDRAHWFDVAHKALMPAGFSHTMVEMIGENEEGLVLYWPAHYLRVKMKGPEYVRLHRITSTPVPSGRARSEVITIVQPEKDVRYIWPPVAGKMFLVPTGGQRLAIGDAFLWQSGDETHQMQVIGLNGPKVLAVLD